MFAKGAALLNDMARETGLAFRGSSMVYWLSEKSWTNRIKAFYFARLNVVRFSGRDFLRGRCDDLRPIFLSSAALQSRFTWHKDDDLRDYATLVKGIEINVKEMALRAVLGSAATCCQLALNGLQILLRHSSESGVWIIEARPIFIAEPGSILPITLFLIGASSMRGGCGRLVDSSYSWL